MTYTKMLGLGVVAAAALVAFVGVGTASAGGVLCSTTSNPCTSKWTTSQTLDFSLKAGTSAKVVNAAEPTEVLDTCTGTVNQAEEEKAEKEGRKAEGTTTKLTLTANPDNIGEATGTNTSVLWKGCTFNTTTLAGFAGVLRVSQITGTSNGTVRSDGGLRITLILPFFGTCVFGWKNGPHLGVITEGIGSAVEFKVEQAPLEKEEGSSFGCPPNAALTASYVLTKPSNTTLSVSSS